MSYLEILQGGGQASSLVSTLEGALELDNGALQRWNALEILSKSANTPLSTVANITHLLVGSELSNKWKICLRKAVFYFSLSIEKPDNLNLNLKEGYHL